MKIVITGALAIASHLAKFLSRSKEDVTLIDEDGERLAALGSNYDIMTLQASPCSLSALREAGVDKADLFVAVTSDENVNVQSCIMARHLGAKKVVAKVDNKEYIDEENTQFFKELGLTSIIYPEMLAARDIINGLEMSWVRQRWDVHDGALVMLGIKLRSTCTILDKPLREFCGPQENYTIVAVKRGDETIIPHGNDELHLYDIAYFVTTPEYIPYIRQVVGKEQYADVRNVLLMGGGKTAVRAMASLPDGMHAKVIEIDERRCEQLNTLIDNPHVLIINGDGRDMPLLQEEGIKTTQAFVALTGNTETNILACLSAKRMGVRKTIARVENLDYEDMAERLDIGTIINKKAIAASHIYQMMLDSNVRNMRFLNAIDADVAEFIAMDKSKVTKKPIRNLDLPRGLNIGGIVRDGKGILITGETQIMPGDSVLVFMYHVDIDKVERLFNNPTFFGF